jgi:tetratricopeptide (TPR) repeat protein
VRQFGRTNEKPKIITNMSDWYRRKTWTENDEIEFFAKLNRARKDGRAQYLKIQAIELLETKNGNLINVAENLLNKYFEDFPEDNFNKSSCLGKLGEIYSLRNDYLKAIEYLKKAIEFEKVFPNVTTQATIKLSEIVIENNIVSEYKYVEEILMMKINSKSGLTFNNEKYIVYSILSIINNENGNEKIAKEYAEIAEQNANLESSGLTYHKKLGIVTKRNSILDEKLNK